MSSARKAWKIAVPFVLLFPCLLMGVTGTMPPMWLFGIVFLLAIAVLVVRVRDKMISRRKKANALKASATGKVACPSCGYWLGQEQQQCSECGMDPAEQPHDDWSPRAKKVMTCLIFLWLFTLLGLLLWRSGF